MKRKMDSKTKILTAAVLCACTTLCVNTAWAADYTYLNNVLYGGGGPQVFESKDSNNNSIEMTESTYTGTATGNITGDVKGVYGGFALLKDKYSWDDEPDLEAALEANDNKVVINGGNIVGGSTTIAGIGSSWNFTYDNAVAGGYSNYTLNNTVIINDGNIATDIYGGLMEVSNNENQEHPEIVGNMVYIAGGNITGENIAGVYITDEGRNNRNIVKNNGVEISGGVITAETNNGNIYGAYADDYNCILENNKVIIKGGQINASDDSKKYTFGIYGACADRSGSSANNNIVEISDGTVTGAIYGAYAYASNNNELINNKVIITGGSVSGNVYAVYSRNGAGTVKDNGIEISGNADLSEAELHGYDSSRSSNQSGQYLKADNYQGSIKSIDKFDTVNISNGSKVAVEEVDLYSYDYSDDATNGILIVNESELDIGGLGYVNELSVQSGILKANDIYATDNIQIVNSAGTINLLGDSVGDILIENSDLKVNKLYEFDNLIINNDNKRVVELGNIDGSSYFDSNTYTQRGSATINTDSQFKANSIIGLKELNVDMTAINWEKDSAVIDVSGAADLTNTAISATGTLAAAAGTAVQNGDRMSFIKAGTLTGASAANVDVKKLQIGFASEADVELQDGANSIDWVVTGATAPTEQTKIIGESRTAAVAFVNQGSDILDNAFGLLDDGKYGIKTFAAAHGNYSRYDTGSNLKVNGWSVLAGVGDTVQKDNGSFSWGVFYENGSGNYRTYNDYSGLSLEGFGNAVYNGGGAMARFRANDGTYAELGVRAGMLKNSLSNAVADGFGMHGGYDTETNYFGTHLGVGHIYNIDGSRNIDIYGKYFYTRHSGESFEILGDKVEFDDAESSRLRLGLRYNTNTQNDVSFYYGAAWDYEFNGKAQVKAADFYTGNPSLKGSTAMIEAGVHYAPDNSPWSIDFGLQGYGGKRDGFSGTMQVNYSFN